MNDDGMFDLPTPPDTDAADPSLVTVQERLREVGAAWRARPLPLAPLLGHLHTLAAEGHADHPPIALQEEMTFMSTSSVAIPSGAARRRWFIVPVVTTALLVALSIGFFAFFAHHATTAPVTFTSSTVIATPVVTNARGFQRYATSEYDIDTLITGSDGKIWFAGNVSRENSVIQAEVGHVVSPKLTSIYSIPGTPRQPGSTSHQVYYCSSLSQGSDGALWFLLQTIQSTSSSPPPFSKIVRVATNGTMTVFTPPTIVLGGTAPYLDGLTAGPDGALWFTASDTRDSNQLTDYRLGRITTAGSITYHALPSNMHPVDITAGPDDALWFTTDNGIERMTLQGALMAYPVTGRPTDLRFTPDGVLWFEDYSQRGDRNAYLGRFDRMQHTVTYITLPMTNFLMPLGVGPDGHIWFTQERSIDITKPDRHLYTVSAADTLTEVALPDGNLSGAVTAGPDGNLWFADFTDTAKGGITNYIARITL